jgi:hypothetical protein
MQEFKIDVFFDGEFESGSVRTFAISVQTMAALCNHFTRIEDGRNQGSRWSCFRRRQQLIFNAEIRDFDTPQLRP